MKVNFKTMLGLTSAVGLVHMAPAAAQTVPPPAAPPAAPRATQTGDIIVTARRSEERLQDVPISITVFSQQDLANRNIVQAADLVTFTPSLTVESRYGPLNTSFAIRGFNQQIGTSPTVGVYFADVISPRGAANNLPIGGGAGPGNLFDLQNVQILKGPQGTLFGLNTTGGAVLLVPQKPTDKFEGYVEASYGNYDMKRLQAVLNVPLGEKARFRIGVDRQNQDGYLKNVTSTGPRDFADVNYIAVRASLAVDLTPDLENYTIVSYLDSDTHGDVQPLFTANTGLTAASPLYGFAQMAAQQLADRAAAGGGFYSFENRFPDPSTTYNQWQIINTTTLRASDNITIKNIASYSQLKQNIRSSFLADRLDLYYFPFQVSPGVNIFPFRAVYTAPGQGITGAAIINRAPGANTANQSDFTNEFQVQGHAMEGNLVYQAGAYFESSQPLGLSGSLSQPLLVCADPDVLICANPLRAGSGGLTLGKTKTRNVGLYTQASYSFTDQLKLNAGLRYTWDRTSTNGQKFTYVFAPGFTPGPPIATVCTNPIAITPDCRTQYQQKSSAPTWLIGLDYKPTQDILLYAKYSRGYRTGGIAQDVPPEYAIFDPEKLDAYETGWKTSFRGAVRGTFNVAAFYNKFTNEQTLVTFAPIIAGSLPSSIGVINADKSRSYGVEVDASITPFEGFTIEGGYAYVNSKVQKISPVILPAGSPYFAVSSSAPGSFASYLPKNKYTIAVTYKLPLDNSIGDVSLGANFSHADSNISNYTNLNADGSLSNLSKGDPINLLNLNLNWNGVAGLPVDLQLFMTNVTDEKYYTEKSGLYSQLGYETAGVGRPRMYGARLRYTFGK